MLPVPEPAIACSSAWVSYGLEFVGLGARGSYGKRWGLYLCLGWQMYLGFNDPGISGWLPSYCH